MVESLKLHLCAHYGLVIVGLQIDLKFSLQTKNDQSELNNTHANLTNCSILLLFIHTGPIINFVSWWKSKWKMKQKKSNIAQGYESVAKNQFTHLQIRSNMLLAKHTLKKSVKKRDTPIFLFRDVGVFVRSIT